MYLDTPQMMTDNQSALTSGASRRKFIAVAGGSAVALAGCTSTSDNGGDNGNNSSNGGSQDLSGDITITGSSTVFPLMEAISARFKQDNGGVDFDISPTGSGGGFANHFCPGNADFNNASRPIKSEEEQQCSDNDVEYIELTVATDALTVVVNNDADFIDCITVEELAQIWEADAPDDQTWQDVNSDWPDEEINRFGAADTSGTYDYFIENVQGADRGHTDDYQATEQDNSIAQGVQGDKHAIGYFGFSYYFQNSDSLKALAVDDGSGCTEPSLETASSGEYQPLSRSLYTYPSKSALADDHVAEFARFVLEQSTNETLVAEEVGYVPNTDQKKQEEMEELNSAIEEA
jgi:phosphate transport system substrate-binding protein